MTFISVVSMLLQYRQENQAMNMPMSARWLSPVHTKEAMLSRRRGFLNSTGLSARKKRL